MKTIDALGKPCPMPVVMAKKALEEGGGELAVLVDNAVAVENLKRLAGSRGMTAAVSGEAGRFCVVITGEGQAPRLSQAEPAPLCGPVGRGDVVVVAKDHLGEGAEELGGSLLRMFLYTLAQGDKVPAALLFLNGGVRLPAGEEEQILQSIAELEEKGCRVLVCGTCLNYYGLTDRLKVGIVSNMYDLVEAMQAGEKVIAL